MDNEAPGLGGEQSKLTLRPPEEHDTEDDTTEIEIDDLDMAEVLKLAKNEGLDPAAVESGIRKEIEGSSGFRRLSRHLRDGGQETQSQGHRHEARDQGKS